MKKKIVLSLLLVVLIAVGTYGYNYINGLKLMYDSMKDIDISDIDISDIDVATDDGGVEQKNGNDADSETVSTEVASKDIEVSKEQIEKAEQEITFKDKAKATKMVVSKLSPSDINRLRQLAAGGLGPEEKKEAVGIAYSNFSEEELQFIKRIYRSSK